MKKKWIDDLVILTAIDLKNKAVHNPSLREKGPLPYHSRTQHSLPEKDNRLQHKAEKLSEFARTNFMQINQTKTKVAIFNPLSKVDILPQISLDWENCIEVVDEYKLLGQIISTDMKTLKNTKNILKTAYSKMYMLHHLNKLGIIRLSNSGVSVFVFFYVCGVSFLSLLFLCSHLYYVSVYVVLSPFLLFLSHASDLFSSLDLVCTFCFLPFLSACLSALTSGAVLSMDNFLALSALHIVCFPINSLSWVLDTLIVPYCLTRSHVSSSLNFLITSIVYSLSNVKFKFSSVPIPPFCKADSTLREICSNVSPSCLDFWSLA